MIREEVNLIMVIFIFIACIFLLASISQGSSPEQTKEVPQGFIRPKVEYNAGGFIDPFVNRDKDKEEAVVRTGQVERSFAPEVKRDPPKLELQGITWGGRFPQAIINSRVVKAGDTMQLDEIQGTEIGIINIDKDGIVFSFEDSEYKIASPAMMATSDKESKGGR